MSKESLNSGFRNGRFLVSVWYQPHLRSESDRFVNLRGTVWKADPGKPGRIVLPESFNGLSALSGVLRTLLMEKDDDRPDQSGGET